MRFLPFPQIEQTTQGFSKASLTLVGPLLSYSPTIRENDILASSLLQSLYADYSDLSNLNCHHVELLSISRVALRCGIRVVIEPGALRSIQAAIQHAILYSIQSTFEGA